MSRGSSSQNLDTENRLREEVRLLRDELRRLTVRVDQQADQLSDLHESVSVISSAQSFEVGSAGGATSTGPVEPRTSEFPVEEPRIDPVGPYSWDFRQQVAREIGAFVKRSLQGEHQGESGRNKIRGLQNRVYVVARDFENKLYNPPLVVKSFSRVKSVCYKDGSWGDSVFVGLPSYGEASIVVSAAGLQWPSEFS